MEREIEDLCPCAAANGRGGVLVLLTPDKYFAIVGRRGQNCAEFRVRLVFANVRRDADDWID